MTIVATRRPDQAERIAHELTAKGYACECGGCLVHTDAPGGAVITAAYVTGVQAESMAGIDEGPASSIEEAVSRYTRCRAYARVHRHHH